MTAILGTIVASLFSGGGTLLLSILGTVFPTIAKTIGDTWLRARETRAAQERDQDQAGKELASSWLASVTEANKVRAEVRSSEGKWGPMPILMFVVGAAFAIHTVAVVLDSFSYLPSIGLRWYVVPWLEWAYHRPGSWDVKALPDDFRQVELEVLRALFYVGPPSTALMVAARIFRR